MKDCTRVRRLTKIYVAWNAEALNPNKAIVKISKLFRKDCHEAWMKYMGMTDLARERFLKEVIQ